MAYADLLFTTVFTFECAIKIYGYGRKDYLESNWNRLDFVIVIGALLDVAFTFWIKMDAADTKSVGLKINILSPSSQPCANLSH